MEEQGHPEESGKQETVSSNQEDVAANPEVVVADVDSDPDDLDEDVHVAKSGMDIMMSLEGSALNDLRSRFETKEEEEGDGLDLDEFVDTFLEFLTPDQDDRKHLVTDLVELFHQIDINGDGTVEWEEFTSYCVEAGLLATRRVKIPLKYQFVEDKRFVDKYTKGELSGITWIPEINRLAVLEKGTCVLKMYDNNFLLRGTVDLTDGVHPEEQKKNESEHKIRQDIQEVKASVLTVCYVVPKNILVIASSDLGISLWECGLQKKNPFLKTSALLKPDEYRFCGQIHTAAMVLKLKFCPVSDLVWAVGGHEVISKGVSEEPSQNHPGIIQGYKVVMTTAGGLKDFYDLSPFFRLEGYHRACAMDILEIEKEGVLVTSSIDKHKNLGLWDIHTKKFRSPLQGHSRGVVSIVYADDQNLLVSAGFEYEALIWDVKGSKFPIMTISGHHSPLVGVSLAPFTTGSNAITLDRKGNFKMWDIRRSTHSKALLLEAWEVSQGVGGFQPKCFDIMVPGKDCVAAGYNLHVFKCRRKRTTEMIPSFVQYNPEFMKFAVAFGSDILIYNAEDGAELQHYRNIGKSEITSMCLDRRYRKLIVGYHNGDILVHNFMNGAVMKRFQGHSCDVTALVMIRQDDCLVSTSWDKSIRVFDEIAPGEGLSHPPTVSSMRSINDVHDRDVGCMAVSHTLSLVATAATDFKIRIWDFQQLKLEKNGSYLHHTVEITCIKFVDPYPILVSCDCSGLIAIWTVRPDVNRGRVLHAFHNLSVVNEFVSMATMQKIEKREKEENFAFLTGIPLEKNETEEEEPSNLQPVAVNAIAISTSKGFPELYSGDDVGSIKKWDLKCFIGSYKITPVTKSVTGLISYNARRRFHRSAKGDINFEGNSGTRNKPGGIVQGKNKDVKVTMVKAWKAHSDAINHLHAVNERPFCVVSSSMDLSCRIWSCDGLPMGSLCVSVLEKQRIAEGRAKKVPWLLTPPINHRRHERLKHGQFVMESVDKIKEQKAKRAQKDAARVAIPALVRSRAPSPKSEGGGSKSFSAILGQLEKPDDSNTLPPLKESKGQKYRHFSAEMSSRERVLSSAIALQTPDLELSPFLQEQLGATWHPQTEKKSPRNSIFGQSLPKNPRPPMVGSASAPELLPPVADAEEKPHTARVVEVSEAVKIRKRIRMRKTLTRVNSMLAEAELMENVHLGSSEQDRLRNVHSSIFGARASAEIPLKAGANVQRVKHFGPYTMQDVQSVRALFNSYDDDGSGSIDSTEFRSSANMKHQHLFENAGSMFSAIDKDGSGTVTFQEMCEAVFPNLPESVYQEMLDYVTNNEESQRKRRNIQLAPKQVEEIKEIFHLFDVDKSGGITIEELYGALASSHGSDTEEFETYFSMEELRKLVLQYDADGNETLDIDEFVNLFHDNFYDDGAVNDSRDHSSVVDSNIRY